MKDVYELLKNKDEREAVKALVTTKFSQPTSKHESPISEESSEED
jgi:hypothetical protein